MLQITTRLIMEAALARGWKAEPLDERFVSTLAITPPKHRTYYFDSCQPPLTSAAAMVIADNKLSTYLIAKSQDVPVADFLMVEPGNLQSARDFLQDQVDNGYQVVVKPIDTNHGDGITVGVATEESLVEALNHAKQFSRRILLQRRHYGGDCRVLVIDGKFFAAGQRVPAYVIGDGFHTVDELIALKNSDPQRDEGHSANLTKIDLASVKRFLGTASTRIPKEGEHCVVVGTANLSRGGEAHDISTTIHPSFKKAAERLTQSLDMFVCGVDFMALDHTKPLAEDNAILLEVNATPGLRMHHFPARGKSHDAAGAILDAFVAKITGTNR